MKRHICTLGFVPEELEIDSDSPRSVLGKYAGQQKSHTNSPNPEILGTFFVPPSSTRVTSNPFGSAVMFSAQRTGNRRPGLNLPRPAAFSPACCWSPLTILPVFKRILLLRADLYNSAALYIIITLYVGYLEYRTRSLAAVVIDYGIPVLCVGHAVPSIYNVMPVNNTT
nr:unnamed protein product [Callosobruchus chinensis]